MNTLHCILHTSVIILITPLLNAQDITGDWYGKGKHPDSLLVVLHISKDHDGLKATFDRAEASVFGMPLIEFTFKNDTLSFHTGRFNFIYKGCVNKDYSKIEGSVIQYANKYNLDFSRKKLSRIIPVDYNSLTTAPAKSSVKPAEIPVKVPYAGIKIVEPGNLKPIQIDTSKLRVLTPGKGNVLNPRLYKYPQPVTEEEYNIQQGFNQWAPVVSRAEKTRKIPVSSMRMKDEACLNIQYLDVEQGLIDPVITCILEDKTGILWFGTNLGGICSYDGYYITTYADNEGLINQVTRSILEDRYGNIWIGTDWGLFKYDGKYFTHYRGNLFSGIWSMMESGDGNLWFGSRNGAFIKKGDFWIQYTTDEGLINNWIYSIIEDRYGNIWFGTDGGLCKFDGKSFTHFTENEGLISNRVRSIIEDRQGKIWIGTVQGVSRYDGYSFSQFTAEQGLSNKYINSIMEDSSGNLWFATMGDGVNVYDGKTFTHYTTREGLTNNYVMSVMEDKDKNIWLATSGNGIMKLRKSSFIYFTQSEDLSTNTISSVIEDRDGNIWLGIYNKGLVKYDGESFMIMMGNDRMEYNYIHSILEDKEANIWATDNNNTLIKYDQKSVTIYENKEIWNSVYGNFLYENTNENIWIGTWGEGIKIFDGISFTDFISISSPTNKLIRSILQDSERNVWYGTVDGGLFKYNDKNIIQYTISDGLSSTRISALFEDKNSNLWIGTQDAGVNKFDGESFICFTEKEGLINNSVTSVIGDKKGNIWVGTVRGLSLILPQKNGSYSITSFGYGDGLKELYFNLNSVCLDSHNCLWWGTGNIVTRLDLNTFELIPKPPVLKLNDIQIKENKIDFGSLLAWSKVVLQNLSDTLDIKLRGLKFSDVAPFYNYPLDLKLAHNLNHLTFNFSAIDWTSPQSIRYQYMLEGMEEQWSQMSNENKADYRNIPSGKYKFKVKAISASNIWSDTFEYPFIVRPPLWFRWWAFTIYALAFILLAFYYVRYIISRERIKAEVQIKQIEVDKMQELDQMKSRFFANISHEFRTPLTLLLGPINDLLKNRPGINEGERNLLKIMKRNADRLHQLINQLLDLSKLETGNLKLEVSEGDLTGFIRIIILSFISLAESKHIRYEYELSEADKELYFDCDKVEKIVMNFISNALKFTPDGGSVMVTLQYCDENDTETGNTVAAGEYAKIIVKDTGPGIPKNEREKIFDRFYQVSSSDSREHEGSGIGLALAKELVELYRGKIHIESEIGKGSVFTVLLPVSKEQFREEEIVPVSPKPSDTKSFEGREIPVEKIDEPAAQEHTFQEKEKELPIILIVEDNTDLRKYISANLLDKYQILEAGNGKEGLDIAVESIPDMVISDLMMPEMDGIEMCRHLKNDVRTSHIPLIMITAKADRGSKLEGLETGADDYIIKPFDAEELQVRVKNLIQQRRNLRERYRKELVTDPTGPEIPSTADELLVRVMKCLKEHMAESEFSVEYLSKELGLSHSQLYRKMLALTDHSPNEFIRNMRLKMAARMFLEGQTNISSVLYTVGYNSPSYFTESFKELFGLNPSDYIKQKGAGTENYYK